MPDRELCRTRNRGDWRYDEVTCTSYVLGAMQLGPLAMMFGACAMVALVSGGAGHGAPVPAACSTITAATIDDCVRLNEIQPLGTHNSYHVAPPPAVVATLGARGLALEYTHRPLLTQLSELGIRQFALDVFADPEGGRFARPAALRALDREIRSVFDEESPFGSGYRARLPDAERLTARCDPVTAPSAAETSGSKLGGVDPSDPDSRGHSYRVDERPRRQPTTSGVLGDGSAGKGCPSSPTYC